MRARSPKVEVIIVHGGEKGIRGAAAQERGLKRFLDNDAVSSEDGIVAERSQSLERPFVAQVGVKLDIAFHEPGRARMWRIPGPIHCAGRAGVKPPTGEAPRWRPRRTPLDRDKPL